MFFHAAILLLLGIADASPIAGRSPRLSPNAPMPLKRSTASMSRLRTRQNTGSSPDLNGILTDVTIDSQTFEVVVDTGSSDSWLITPDFDCVSGACAFGPAFTPGSSFEVIPDVHMDAEYADKTFAQGEIGQDTVTIADVTVSNQYIGAASRTSWGGDGRASGLFGLGLPSLTKERPGTDLTNNSGVAIQYSSIVNTIFADGLSNPEFSLAISRDETQSGNAGYLTFGGTPDLNDPEVNVTSYYATAPWEINDEYNSTGFSVYTISTDSFSYSNSTSSQTDENSYQMLVDSGTTLIVFPEATATAVNSMWNPPATLTNGTWYIDCDAVAPTVSVMIGRMSFSINPVDLVFGGVAGSSGTCSSSIVAGNPTLGEYFLRNVLVVYDWGNEQILFAQRPYYSS